MKDYLSLTDGETPLPTALPRTERDGLVHYLLELAVFDLEYGPSDAAIVKSSLRVPTPPKMVERTLCSLTFVESGKATRVDAEATCVACIAAAMHGKPEDRWYLTNMPP